MSNGATAVHRRDFLKGTAGLAGGAVAAGALAGGAMAQEPSEATAADAAAKLPDYASWKDASKLIVHSDQTLETQRAALGLGGITPNDILYVRNNLPSPSEEAVGDRDAWPVTFDGVASPREMTVAELKALGVEAVATVLQCSGNGRAFFDHEASGSQWEVGAAGNVLWTGVPVRLVVEELGGVADGMNFMTSTGGEELPAGLDPNTIVVERSVPKEAMENALLAYEMNGAPIPIANGGPLRLIVPGYYGINNIKYVKRVAFTAEESPAKIQQTGYRVRPVGVEGDPSQPSMWKMSVKSFVTSPIDSARSGRLLITGVAFGGADAVKSVEVSTDGGETWQEAEFVGPDLGPFAWRPFALPVELEAGSHTIASRATDAAGDVQPEEFEPNERGYGHNGWRAHAVEVAVS